MKIKKSLFYSCLSFIFINSVCAQITDLMGSMAIGAAQNNASIKSVGMLNKKANLIQFIQQLQLKIADISMTYFGNYRNMSNQNLIFKNVKAVFKPIEEGRAFEVEITFDDKELCFSLLSDTWDNLEGVRILGSFYSQSEAIRQAQGLCEKTNQISLIFQ